MRPTLMLRYLLLLAPVALYPLTGIAAKPLPDERLLRIAVVSSYHPEYQWSQGTNDGLTQGLLDFGYLDNRQQIENFTRDHRVTSSRVEVRKLWMDTKHKNRKNEIARTLASIVAAVDEFQPDILLLGDDNAANYVGNYYLDSPIPMVFWGVNGTPLKYGLIDSIEHPGHNVTGIYQKNYYEDNIALLMRLAPHVKRVAVLSDDSATGRTHSKLFRAAALKHNPALQLVEVVNSNDFATWKEKALALEQRVDAFLISTNYTLRDDRNAPVSADEVVKWYLRNIDLPEVAAPINLVRRGMLASVFDSPFKQGYETARMAHRILGGGEKAGQMSPYAPDHGGYVVNNWRAQRIGLKITDVPDNEGFHEIIDSHVALD